MEKLQEYELKLNTKKILKIWKKNEIKYTILAKI